MNWLEETIKYLEETEEKLENTQKKIEETEKNKKPLNNNGIIENNSLLYYQKLAPENSFSEEKIYAKDLILEDNFFHYTKVNNELQLLQEELKSIEKDFELNKEQIEFVEEMIDEKERIEKFEVNNDEIEEDFVVRGATLKCRYGSHERKLNLLKDHAVYINDLPMIHERNIDLQTYFGVCSSPEPMPSSEQVELIKITYDSNGNEIENVVKGTKCNMCIIGYWNETDEEVKIVDNGDICERDKLKDREDETKGFNAVTTKSFLICKYKGIIEFVDSGQVIPEEESDDKFKHNRNNSIIKNNKNKVGRNIDIGNSSIYTGILTMDQKNITNNYPKVPVAIEFNDKFVDVNEPNGYVQIGMKGKMSTTGSKTKADLYTLLEIEKSNAKLIANDPSNNVKSVQSISINTKSPQIDINKDSISLDLVIDDGYGEKNLIPIEITKNGLKLGYEMKKGTLRTIYSIVTKGVGVYLSIKKYINVEFSKFDVEYSYEVYAEYGIKINYNNNNLSNSLVYIPVYELQLAFQKYNHYSGQLQIITINKNEINYEKIFYDLNNKKEPIIKIGDVLFWVVLVSSLFTPAPDEYIIIGYAII